MKLSFSTVGCPEWMLNEVLAAASDFGYDGVEIRGLGEDIFLPKAPCFGPKRLATSLKEIAAANVEISCLSSDASCLLSSHSLDVPLEYQGVHRPCGDYRRKEYSYTRRRVGSPGAER